MTVDEIRAEMQRKPDAHALLEWIYERPGVVMSPNAAEEIRDVIDAYFEASAS